MRNHSMGSAAPCPQQRNRVRVSLTHKDGWPFAQSYTQEEVEDEMLGVNAHTGHRRRAKGHRIVHEEEEEEEVRAGL